MTVAGIVLAAGAGHRFRDSGSQVPKQLVTVGGDALVTTALVAALAAGLAEVAVVQGAVDLRAVVPDGVAVLDNPRWAAGMATSVRVATDYARARGHVAVVIGLADQPGVTADAWRAVAMAPDDPPIAVATYDGRRANPVRLGQAVWSLLPVAGDEGARGLMRGRPELVREVPCTGEPDDVDTLEDLDRWS